MPKLSNDKNSVCSLAQKQCCIRSLNSIRCDSGVTSAKAGRSCEGDDGNSCMDDSYQVCCSCCALGLWMRRQGQGCDADLHLGPSCGHVFLTCCEEVEARSQLPLRGQENLKPTVLPRRGTYQSQCGYYKTFPYLDVDECLTHKCLPHQRCVNTEGSFTCRPQITCPPGYHLKSSGCQDVDECAMRKDRCGKDFLCENTPGSFKCIPKQKCLSGFTQDAHGNCVDINECSSLAQPCSSSFACVNTVGSFNCQQKVLVCNRGYHTSPDGASCADVDECQMGSHACGVGQICHNLPGSYRCDCQTGYQFDALRKVCTDVNECWSYPGRLCAQTCENTVGSYLCTCTAGFILASDQKNCEDINECDQKPCSQECVNMHGSYQCYCRQGYYLHEDGLTCEDIDECSQSIGKLCAFQCVNVVGSYLCACPPHGYVMSANGHTCTDVDECKVGSHNCSSEKTCFNLQGGFRCLSFDCPHNYKKVSSTLTHCKRCFFLLLALTLYTDKEYFCRAFAVIT
uniref:Fibulin 2 n=1 Tax=Oryzias sinensis TaxID=183150 RepID=A0A8C7Z651_9TELE